MKQSDLDRWLFSKNYWVYDKNNVYTHTILTGYRGGKIRIGTGNNDDEMSGQSGFNYHYANEVKKGTPLYIQEARTDKFKYFIDLDMLHTEDTITDEEYDLIMKTVTDTVKLFFPDLSMHSNLKFMSLLLTSSSKKKEENRYKHGIHIIFPKIIVDSHSAFLMREMMIENCLKVFGTKFALNGWEDVIDQCVYARQSTGLRLIFSRKAIKCKCKGKKKDSGEPSCMECGGEGWYEDGDDGRPYTMKYAYDDGLRSEHVTKYLADNIVKLVDHASIRCKEEQTTISDGWVRYEGCPSYMEPSKTGKAKITGPIPKSFAGDRQAMKSWKLTDLPEAQNAEKWKIVKNYIHNRLGYPEIRIKSLRVNAAGTQYFINVDGVKSNYCQNVRRDHNSNSIYFFIDSRGICQKCFSRKATTEGRFNGLCKDFASKPKALSDNEQNEFFPKQNKPKGPKPTFLTSCPANYAQTLQNELFANGHPPPKRFKPQTKTNESGSS